ncbi:MAG: ATP-binding protein [Polyangiaceae bacterium]|nr:ATP-binding protein [Polyangiaceae bacterium]
MPTRSLPCPEARTLPLRSSPPRTSPSAFPPPRRSHHPPDAPDALEQAPRHDLLEVVEDRYGRVSTIVTSQLPVSKWHEWIGDPTLADAILDRLVHDAYEIELRGHTRRKEKTTTTHAD